MTLFRRFGAPLALALTFALAACSSPENFNKPVGLEPQFGSADNDDGVDVATLATGRIYALSEQTGTLYEDYEGQSEEVGFYTKTLLRRYDANGAVTWTKQVAVDNCHWDAGYYGLEDCSFLDTKALMLDTGGNAYVLTSGGYTSYNGYDPEYTWYTLHKYTASGSYVRSMTISNHIYGPNSSNPQSQAVGYTAVDGSGNIYAVGNDCSAIYDDDGYTTVGGDCNDVVTKRSSTGSVQWQRTSTVGTPYGITVSSSGSVFVTGSKGIARYTSTGNLTWTKVVGRADQIIVAGSHVYTRYQNTLKKFDGNGKLLWTKAQSGLSGLNTQDMTGDTAGNLYLSGKYNATSSDRSAFTRKLNASGSVLWTKTFGTTAFDDAKGIATINGSEIYVTGLTKGSLAHTNIGGDDGYIRKLNSSGTALWTK